LNTPAHVLVGLAVLSESRLSEGAGTRANFWILAGALLPDAPMFLFFAWQWAILGEPQFAIWNEIYFRDSWQVFFDVFNSIPLAVVGLALSLRGSHRGWALLFASMLLHLVLDLPLHHDDAHAHFLPFTSWHFESPVSYWDPRHYGWIGAGLELIAVLACSVKLWRRASLGWRVLLVALCAISVGGYVLL
jgi:hypothetical protein